MAAELTSSELTELAALTIVEPDVGYRIDEGFARVLHFLHGVTGQKGNKSVEEFIWKRGPVDRKAVAKKWSSQWEILQMIAREKARRESG